MCSFCAGLGAAAKWKEKIQQNVQSLFSSKSVDMQHLVYGSGYQAEVRSEDASLAASQR